MLEHVAAALVSEGACRVTAEGAIMQRAVGDWGFNWRSSREMTGTWQSYLTQSVFKSSCKNRFPHKSVNLFFISVIVKDKLTNLWGILTAAKPR